MNTIDIILCIILLLGGLNGLRQGFVKACVNLVGWIFALIIGAKYAQIVAPSMSSISHDPVAQKIAAFTLIVFIIIVLTWIVSAFLNTFLKILMLGPLNRLLGGAFGTLKSLMIVLVIMQGLSPWVANSPYWTQSKLIQSLLPYAPIVTELSKDVASQAFSQMNSKDYLQSKQVDPETDSDHHEQSSHSTKNPFY